ncbi:MAG: TrkA family potassium uptake protein [Bacilli bacterium]|nr:TrkA family potassium uptake protein [Bacilli bacterium]
MAHKSFAVIGLGQFGRSVVHELVDNKMDVIAIDNNEEIANQVAAELPTTFIADSTDEKALREIGVNDVDVAVVAFGDNQQASVLTTVILRELGIKNIIVRVDDDYYVPIMKKLGATEVITPQKAAGAALANRIGNEDFQDYYKLDSKYSVVSIIVNPAFMPITLKEMSPKTFYGVNVVLIKRGNKSFVPGGTDSLLPDDTVYVVGTAKEITTFREAINGKRRRK